MIDFLCEMRDFWIWCASLLALTAVLWAVPRTRRMPGIMMTGFLLECLTVATTSGTVILISGVVALITSL